jgi:segregation and condensation protein B
MSEEEKKLKAAIEALLFATNGLTVEEICKRLDITKDKARQLLEELELEHLESAKGIHILQEGEIWKMSVKPEMTYRVKDLIPPELPSALTKTLAIIAAKKPVKQSVVVRIRGNKAYEHVKKLEKLGFVTSQKFGSTKILDLTEKFFKYFQLKEIERSEKFKLDEETKAALEKAEREVEEEEKAARQNSENKQ